ncbi:hypothetical protein [Methanofollis ethanolicus]|uniref:hypothetical protein n=1 Tax=Methanofollis ethanolicus TaxID=488124 RepID=UPI000831859F|nr:hypothetical protein [Methanofollis ethanolicus]
MTDSAPRTAAGTFASEREPGKALERDELARMLSDVLKNLHGRLTAPRFKTKKADSEMLSMARVFVQAITALDGLIKNSELQEIEQRLSALEEPIKEREKPNRA